MSITNKGFVFSIDTAISAIALLLMLFTATSFLGLESRQAVSNIKEFELWKNAVLLADALVKNNAKQPLLGLACFDSELHRVKSNELCIERQGIETLQSNEFYIKRIAVKQSGNTKEIFFTERQHGNCISVERLVLVDNKTALLELVLCEK